jgi:predicted protein tyrosine phosphatase
MLAVVVEVLMVPMEELVALAAQVVVVLEELAQEHQAELQTQAVVAVDQPHNQAVLEQEPMAVQELLLLAMQAHKEHQVVQLPHQVEI